MDSWQTAQSGPTVFIVDGDSTGRQTLDTQVGAMGLRTKTFRSAETFLATFDASTPGCLLVEVRMEEMSGLELLERLVQNEIRLPTILVSAHGDVPTVVRAMKAGALNFLERPCRDQELWESLQEAIKTDQSNRQRLAFSDTVSRRMARLTSGEREVLEMLVDGASNKLIAAELGLSVRTIEVRRAKLMKKMKAESLAELVQMALRVEHSFGKPQGSQSKPPLSPPDKHTM
ncbi:MAG TPA: response regulator [Thermoguttaceae bacterium]|nr:response regulator [Thermoguttaceae bacterium]